MIERSLVILTVTKATSNPIIAPTGVNGSPDKTAVRDACYVRTSDGKFNAIYTGFLENSLPPDEVSIRLAIATAWDGPFDPAVTISPAYTSLPPDVSNIGLSDPWVLFSDGLWHMWVSVIPVVAGPPYRFIGHLTASGTAANVPTSGWVFENTRSLSALATGWTSDGLGHPNGVAAAKVHSCDTGGWIMFFCGWGSSDYAQYQVGYATSSSLNGPWTINPSSLLGVPGGYQAEQTAYFKGNGKHYLICNRLGLTGGWGHSGFPDLHSDLWVADSQIGPYSLSQLDFIPRGTGWEVGDIGVVGLSSYDLDQGPIYGIYNAVNTVGAVNYIQSLGAFTLTSDQVAVIRVKDPDGNIRLIPQYSPAIKTASSGRIRVNALGTTWDL